MFSVMIDDLMSERVQFLMTPSLRRAIKAWRHRNEIESEGEALRLLLQRGLESETLSSQETRPRA
jgi:hypothetical protein